MDVVSIFYIYCISYEQSVQSGLVVDDVSGNYWDLGSIPRSPKPCSYFFQHVHVQGFQEHSTMQPTHQLAKWPQGSIQWSGWKHTMLQVKARPSQFPEVNKGLSKWARNSNKTS